MKAVRVLVTGAGSGVGQGIVKALRASTLPVHVLSADIAPLNAALFRADEAVLVPRVEDEGALSQILQIIERNGIDVVMLGSEFDLKFYAANKARIEAETGCMVVVSPAEAIEIADDKWLTTEFLRQHGLPHAQAYLPRDADDAVRQARRWGFPVMLKTRRGTSNRHVHVVHDERQLLTLYPSLPHPMLQVVIRMPSSELAAEYTCSVFRCADGRLLGPFTARRTLRSGSSWVVEVGDFKELHPLLLAIGDKLPTMGSLNVQLAIGESGPAPFEFNARFSGTTAVRAHFGFNEPEMVLRSYLLGESLAQPLIRRGLALRYLEEVFVDDVSAADLTGTLPTGVVRPWF